ncbi:MAG: formate hydrogenlyase [Gracilibacter sp. BRH_c7a]|nr:MAG: formate hydrogenlyase [Gracilibacter sp. BRH_c7a]
MRELLITGGQAFILLLISPLIQGIIKKAKARLQRRRGPKIIQPYHDIIKLMRREAVSSVNTSWITTVVPYIYFSAFLIAASIIPVSGQKGLMLGDIIVFIYLFALARFFLALAALESASAFGGMGSSREMMIASLVEPVFAIALFGMVALSGSTDFNVVAGAGQNISGVLAFFGLMVVTVTETGRIPADNPDTHLELTMVHEGMLLEYSGRQLGLLHAAAWLKQTILLVLLVHLFLPAQEGSGLWVIYLSLFGKLTMLGLILALIESLTVKMRLFRLPHLMASGAIFCLASVLINNL